MKKIYILLIFIILSLAAKTQNNFQKYFTDKQLRIDFIRVGTADTQMVYLKQIYQEPYWGGPHKNLISPFNYGNYRIQLYDSVSDILLFSKTYRTLFDEWVDSPEAQKVPKAFYEVATFPYPKNTVKVIFQKWNPNTGQYINQLQIYINPSDYQIIKDQRFHFKTEKIIDNGEAYNHLDIVFIAEGFQQNQMDKFRTAAEKQANFLLRYEPFKTLKDKINFYIIYSISEESGTDIPKENIWKNTILNSHFNTFNIDRYLTVGDIKTMYDIASTVPYDQIMVIVNTEKYGGGGFYNFYNITVSDNDLAKQVMVHEFGHGFGGLADEYAYSDPANENMYNLKVEPPEPNITTLVEFESKWKSMVADSIPIPTPDIPRYYNTIGAFEGAGYLPKGIYRPQHSCIMRKLSSPFCKVCQQVLKENILFYSDQSIK